MFDNQKRKEGKKMGLLKIIKMMREGKKSQEERFYELAEKYGLYGKVTLHEALNLGGYSGYTLYMVVKNKGEIPPSLPEGFVEELMDLLYEGIDRKKYQLNFEISSTPKTLEDIETVRRVWAMVCDANSD
ncbi:MAG: hypothetical protein CO159_03235 [Candidatus Portnoybacteria bacterium CG_4_9_14_3_um_filter_40_10]|uniref:Uncharacterized protein n=1 Tax=Candidatus Portnoybacteria bacterium CG_4_9_14_3_um_filter_40_10 TaxID=1974804 RepID=A0A2M7YN48_9BACT|nr:MAG: hypothetical protein CO159_03235 [Candidatus Portnoybacteria bacterium CG_4_9_14_3_um_filter_40_10]